MLKKINLSHLALYGMISLNPHRGELIFSVSETDTWEKLNNLLEMTQLEVVAPNTALVEQQVALLRGSQAGGHRSRVRQQPATSYRQSASTSAAALIASNTTAGLFSSNSGMESSKR